MSPSGRFVALRRPCGVELVDVLGTQPRATHALGATGQFVIAGATLCLLDDEGLRAVPLVGGGAVARLPCRAEHLRSFRGRAADAVIVGDTLVTLSPTVAVAGVVEHPAACFPLLGRAVLVARAGRLAISVPARPAVEVPVPGGGTVVDAAPVFGGRLLALLVRDLDGESAVVMTAAGQLVSRTRVPAATWHAFAIERGQLVVGGGDDQLAIVDLRYGRVLGTGRAPHAISELVVDDDGRNAVIAGPCDGEIPIVSLVRVDEMLRATGPSSSAADASPAMDLAPPQPSPLVADATTREVETAIACPVLDAPDDPGAPIDVPDLRPHALGAPLPARPQLEIEEGAEAFADGAEHLAALVELTAARAALAIAEGWHAGRISGDADDEHPFEREVLALAGAGGGHAPAQLAAARARLGARAATVSTRVRASLAAGTSLPFVELAHEYGLSRMATQILVAIIAPRVRGELARLYRILANETQRPTCDEALITLLLAGDDTRMGDEIAGELADGAPLIRHCLVVRDARGGIDVDDVLLARLRGFAIPRSPAMQLRHADRTLEELIVDRGVVRRLLLELADPRPSDEPVRVVIRGRRGDGRHTTIGALAARVDRSIACIDASQLPRGRDHAPALRRELVRAALARAVPVVSSIEVRDGADAELVAETRHVLASHPGPVVVRTTPDAELPLEPGHVDVTLPSLSETARREAFARILASHGIEADVDVLAQRYRIGPGTMTRIANEVARRLSRAPGDPTQLTDEVARQHVAARIGKGATRVTRLASWEQVALPEDMLDSLRELIGRARHGRTVFEAWGYDQRISTARGLSALFYGPPGTGKTMVAGLIARELGLELYRVDLAKIMSKWVGETEKNLGEVFDAAEDGRLMLLFDEADSLFAKRSEVRSSNDRYANLEVNYLLQRLDSFEGVAILTTNLEGSIDPAFKRRLSMRLYFPFPDEELRAQLWASHVTPQVPTAGQFDFAALARRFPLSGGYIRNSALRAAFLAAQEGTPLTQSHLERAVLLEYRELGKLSDDGRLD